LDRPEDFTHLTMGELFFDAAGPGDLRPLVRRRAAELQAYAALPTYHRVHFAGPPVPRAAFGASAPSAAVDDGGWLVGTGCSPGVAQGRVLVARGPVSAADAHGRILLTEATEPGWVFCLAHAAGVISEKGSLLSHTAIVARELGVPLVVGIPGVVEAFAEGDMVRIDGGAGTVERIGGDTP
jgi:pyruvate,water dikinase